MAAISRRNDTAGGWGTRHFDLQGVLSCDSWAFASDERPRGKRLLRISRERLRAAVAGGLYLPGTPIVGHTPAAIVPPAKAARQENRLAGSIENAVGRVIQRLVRWLHDFRWPKSRLLRLLAESRFCGQGEEKLGVLSDVCCSGALAGNGKVIGFLDADRNSRRCDQPTKRRQSQRRTSLLASPLWQQGATAHDH